MSHSFAIVLVPKDTKDIESEVTRLLAPYSEELKVEPYIYSPRAEVIAKKEEIAKSAKDEEDPPNHYSMHKGKIEKMSLKDFAFNWYGKELDEEGNLLTTYNPKSKWDYYEIGGRWNGEIKGNICSVSDLPDNLKPHAIITPDGEWYEVGRLGFWGITINEKPEDTWELEVALLLKNYEDCVAVGIDYHI